MKNKIRFKLLWLCLLSILLSYVFTGCSPGTVVNSTEPVGVVSTSAFEKTTVADITTVAETTLATTDTTKIETGIEIREDGVYTHKDDVALYLYIYGYLPSNYITKYEARKLGWTGGGLDDYAPGKCIGGDSFQNREGILPEKNGRKYYECDIDTLHKSKRGAKRIIYSNDGLIYYTEDHYNTYELLYD